MKACFYLKVEFDENMTDAESVASALDNVISVGLMEVWTDDEYGKVHAEPAFVLVPEEVDEAERMLGDMIDGKPEDEMGEVLEPARKILARLKTE